MNENEILQKALKDCELARENLSREPDKALIGIENAAMGIKNFLRSGILPGWKPMGDPPDSLRDILVEVPGCIVMGHYLQKTKQYHAESGAKIYGATGWQELPRRAGA